MAFRRQVPPLEDLVLKEFTKAGADPKDYINDASLDRAYRICKPSKSRMHRVKNEILKALLQGGKLTDDVLPLSFFDESMTRLEVVGGKITTKFIERMAPKCPKLHTVNLSGCFRLTDDAIEVLLKHCTEVKEINLSNCRKLSDKTLGYLQDMAPKLQGFDIGGDFNMTLPAILKLIEKHPNHAKFSLVHVSGQPITDAALKTIMSKCRKLRSLSIGYCDVSDDAVISLLTKRDAVAKLHVHWNRAITDRLLHYIATNGRNLEELDMCGVKTFTADAILSTVNAKMGAFTEAEAAPAPSPSAHDAADTEEPPRKKLKKINFRYTSIPKDAVASIRETFPDLDVTY